jgi:hypothetical protein
MISRRFLSSESQSTWFPCIFERDVYITIEKVGIVKKSTRVHKTSFREKSAKNGKTTTNIKKYKIYSFFSKF